MFRSHAIAALIGTVLLTGALPSRAVAPPTESSVSGVTVDIAAAPACAVDRVLSDDRINESSGLARSTRFSGVLLTHNDHGDSARYFAVDESGATKAVITLSGVAAVDWEDVATGPWHKVWLADIGASVSRGDTVSVYRLREPDTLRSQTVSSTRFRLRYPDGSHDAEALLVHPSTARLYVVSKERDGTAAIYRAPAQLSSTDTNRLERIRTGIPDRITAGDFSPGGNNLVLRDYTQAFVYPTLTDTPKLLPLPSQSQGESVTYTQSGSALLAGSEGTDSRVCRVTLP